MKLLEDLLSHPWALWLIVALICALLELFLPSFAFIFATMGALTAAVASPYVGWLEQSVIFTFGLFTSLYFLRPYLLRHAASKPRQAFQSRSEAMVGRQGVVTEAIDPLTQQGRVDVEGHDWAARAESVIAVGSRIEVLSADGIVLIVKEV